MKKVCSMAVCLAVAVLTLSGCGGSGISEDRPIAAVKQEAEKMDVNQLKGMVEKYQQAIDAKKPEIQKLQSKLKEIPVTQMMGADAKAIKDDIGKISASVKALTDRMRVYMAELGKRQ